MKPQKILYRLLLLLFLFPQSLFAQEKTLTKVSPNGKFRIVSQTEDLPDLVIKFTSYLVDLESGDSTLLGVSNRHDSPPPNWFWSDKSEYLIYEQSNFGNNSEIIVLDLSTKKIRYKINGAIPILRKFVGNFWDEEREILFFFEFGNDNPKLRSLEIFTQRQELLKTFNEHFGIEIPVIRMDRNNRKVWLNSESYEY